MNTKMKKQRQELMIYGYIAEEFERESVNEIEKMICRLN